MNKGEFKRRRSRENNEIFLYAFLIFWIAASSFFSGCVRASGMAGYWHTNAEEENQVKQVGFDTANLGSKDKGQGSITL